jgi:putative DNA methylase
MSYPIKSPRKLIEVALPLDAINEASAAEKLVKVGKPTNLHLWWARRPLAAARAVIFAQLVNDPGYQQGGGFKYGMNKKEAAIERKRLFGIIEKLVKWENTANEEVLRMARAEIQRSWREVCELNKEHPEAATLFNAAKLPGLHDPFAGGGVIPLEAQRLGLEAYGSDLNPVAVLINKAMIEFPPRFAGRAPVGPEEKRDEKKLALDREWPGAKGLAEDVVRYGTWMRSEAQKRLGHLYPPILVTDEMACKQPELKPLVKQSLTIIAWLWARTVKSPNPAFSHVDVPLASSFVLSSKPGKEVFVQPVIEGSRYYFTIKSAASIGFTVEQLALAEKGTKFAKGQDFYCILSGSPISRELIRDAGKAQILGQRLMAIVAEGPRGRVYIAPDEAHERIAFSVENDPRVSGARESFLSEATPTRAMITGGVCSAYGLVTWGHLFTARQLVALSTFSDLVSEARLRIKQDAIEAGFENDDKGIDTGGTGAAAYAEAISVYLAFAMTRMADWGNSLTRWESKAQVPQQLFGRQAMPMVWDFCEANFFSNSTGSYSASIANIEVSFKKSSSGNIGQGFASLADAQTQSISKGKFVSSDPPYYDNIAYADLSDFFYVWLRRALQSTYPGLLATIVVPKEEELIAAPHRHGGVKEAEMFFLDGMTSAMRSLSIQAHPEAPLTIYYAFKQSETKSESGTSSTGWETFLGAVFRAGLQLTGTWPLRTENSSRMVSQGYNVLASSIVLVCRRRPIDAPTISRREFQRELNTVLPDALEEMTKGSGDEMSPVAPVDLSQAIIGPGMAVFSKYAAVLEADGTSMSVRTALQLINRFLAEDDFDADTQFCLHWFEQYAWNEGPYGTADTLARGKGTGVDGIYEAGVIQSGGGKVRLLKWSEYPTDWDPRTDKRIPVWEALHQLIRALKQGGEHSSGALLAALGGKAESVRQLAYRLYTLCERLGQAEDARAYNELITSWTGIESAAASAPKPTDEMLPGFER